MGLSLVAQNPKPKPSLADDMWLKRQAIQIAAQLPEDRAKALAVLEYAKTLVVDFMMPDVTRDA